MENIIHSVLKGQMKKIGFEGGIFSSETWKLIEDGKSSLLLIVLETFSFYLSYSEGKNMSNDATGFFLGLGQEDLNFLINHPSFKEIREKKRGFDFSIFGNSNPTAADFLKKVIRKISTEAVDYIGRFGCNTESFSVNTLGVSNDVRRRLGAILPNLIPPLYLGEALPLLLPKKKKEASSIVDNNDKNVIVDLVVAEDVLGEEAVVEIVDNIPAITNYEEGGDFSNEEQQQQYLNKSFSGEEIYMTSEEKKPISINWLREKFCKDGNVKLAIIEIRRFFLTIALTACNNSPVIAGVLLGRQDIHNMINSYSIKKGMNPLECTVSLEDFSSLDEVLGAFIRSYVNEERPDLKGKTFDTEEYCSFLKGFCRETYFNFVAQCTNIEAVKMGYTVSPGKIKIFSKDDFLAKERKTVKKAGKKTSSVEENKESLLENPPRKESPTAESFSGKKVDKEPVVDHADEEVLSTSLNVSNISMDDIIIRLKGLAEIEGRLTEKEKENSDLRDELISANGRISLLEAERDNMREILSEFRRLSQKIKN